MASGGAPAVPITVRQLEAITRVSESLAKMCLQPHVTEEHVAEALRLFEVSTIDAARSGVAEMVVLTPEQREVRRCYSYPVESHVQSAWFQRLKLTYDELLSIFAFKYKLRQYR